MAKAPDKKKKSAPAVTDQNTAPAKKTADEALESFLSREQEPEKQSAAPNKKPKLSRGSVALIAAIALVAILIVVILIVVNRPVTPISDDDLPEKPAELATTVDEKGEHHVEVSTDEEGEIKQNGYGELVSYTPSDIRTIEVENTSGSFTVTAETPDGTATVYTVSGLEGFDLQPGMADAVANDAATVSFSSIAAVGGTLADFGLETPRATVKVTYTDNTTATIRVGSEADGGVGTYATIGGSDDIFLVANDAVDSFLYSLLDMVSNEITSKAASVDDSSFSSIELTGARYPDPIVIVPNTAEEIRASYRLTSPYEMFADSVEGNDISGSIRDLYAESVVCVNPSGGQLSSFGVAEPYARVIAAYPDEQIDLSCSAPTDDGLCNLYNPAKGVIYTIRVDALGWANTDLEQLTPKNIIDVNLACVKRIKVSSGGKDYLIDVDYSVKKTKNDSGDTEETAVIKATLDGKSLTEDSFLVFFQNFNVMSNLGVVPESGTNLVYQWQITYNTDRPDDYIALFDNGEKACPAVWNSVVVGTVSKSHLNSLQQDILDLKAGKTPKSL